MECRKRLARRKLFGRLGHSLLYLGQFSLALSRPSFGRGSLPQRKVERIVRFHSPANASVEEAFASNISAWYFEGCETVGFRHEPQGIPGRVVSWEVHTQAEQPSHLVKILQTEDAVNCSLQVEVLRAPMRIQVLGTLGDDVIDELGK